MLLRRLSFQLGQLLIAIDQLINAIVGLFRCFVSTDEHWADETISSHAYRWFRDGERFWPMRLIDMLFFWEHQHCRNAFLSEKYRTQAPPDARSVCSDVAKKTGGV